MSTTTPTTADQLLQMPNDGRRYELVAGELRMMSPSGWKHGAVVGNLHTLLGHHIRQRALGQIFGAETGFLIERDPDTLRAPDISYVAKENLPTPAPDAAYWPGAPDLVVEVLSPNDKTGEVDERIKAWLNAGARLVWIVDPQLSTVTAYRSTANVEVSTENDELEAPDVVPGFRCSVREIFSVIT